MRMWMCDPEIMCRQHLLGEHRELHALVGILNAGKSAAGYVALGLVELNNLWSRHDALVAEMLSRGYRHMSPLPTAPVPAACGQVNREASLTELLRRCPQCRARAKSSLKGT